MQQSVFLRWRIYKITLQNTLFSNANIRYITPGTLPLWKVEMQQGVFLQWRIYKITLQNTLFSNANIRYITLGTLPTSCVTFTVLWNYMCMSLFTRDSCRKNAQLQCVCTLAPRYSPIKYQFVRALYKNRIKIITHMLPSRPSCLSSERGPTPSHGHQASIFILNIKL
jgi:hypothetical protein